MLNWILLFLIVWIFITYVIFLWVKRSKKITDVTSYDDLERLNNHDGNFQYLNNGFYLLNTKDENVIKWNEIDSIIVKPISFNDDLLHFSILIKVKSDYIEINNQTEGFQKFTNKINENLAVSDWSWKWRLHSKVVENVIIYERFQD
ncbi:hypothetical protein [Kaistella sp.]|uniref:hypothetical protein n=1 Tax=Kaistella sp. TaxID=2782235 RepID=UPI003C43EE7F